MSTTALERALESLAHPGAFELELAEGARDAPKRWALTTFGAECRPLVRSARGHSEIRPLERDFILEVDLFFPEREMVELLERVASNSVRGQVRRASVVPIGGVDYHRIELQVPLRTSNPLVHPPPVTTVPRSRVREDDLVTCSHCRSRHWVYVGNKPYPGAERSSHEVACRACWQGTFHVDAWGGYSVDLVDESR
jgi:hypothetical protein